jgi:hypothetical protein
LLNDESLKRKSNKDHAPSKYFSPDLRTRGFSRRSVGNVRSGGGKKPGHETGSILLPNKVPIGQRTRLRNFKSFVNVTVGKAKFCVKSDIFD